MTASLIKGVVVYFGSGNVGGAIVPPPPFPGFTWDAETDVSISYPASASDHPVQAGASDVTDNVHTGPVMISVSGIVSANPLSRPAKMPGVNVDGSAFSTNLAVAMEQLLVGYQRARRRMIVASSRGTWPSCVLLNVDVKWGIGEESLNISAQFKQIRVARQQLVAAVQDADLLAAGATTGGTSTSSSTNLSSWGAG